MDKLTKWLEDEIINGEDAIDRYGQDAEANAYWTGYLHALNNTLDYIVGAEVYIESEVANG